MRPSASPEAASGRSGPTGTFSFTDGWNRWRTVTFWLVGSCFSPAALKRLPGASTPMIMATVLQHSTKPPVAWQLTSYGIKSIGAVVARTPQISTRCVSASNTTPVTCCSSRYVPLRSLLCTHFLLAKTFTPHVDRGSCYRSLWGSSAAVTTRDLRDWWEQEAL